jgi:hypothetical protein
MQATAPMRNGLSSGVVEANLQGGTSQQAQGADPMGRDPVYRIDGVPMGATAQG